MSPDHFVHFASVAGSIEVLTWTESASTVLLKKHKLSKDAEEMEALCQSTFCGVLNRHTVWPEVPLKT